MPALDLSLVQSRFVYSTSWYMWDVMWKHCYDMGLMVLWQELCLWIPGVVVDFVEEIVSENDCCSFVKWWVTIVWTVNHKMGGCDPDHIWLVQFECEDLFISELTLYVIEVLVTGDAKQHHAMGAYAALTQCQQCMSVSEKYNTPWTCCVLKYSQG